MSSFQETVLKGRRTRDTAASSGSFSRQWMVVFSTAALIASMFFGCASRSDARLEAQRAVAAAQQRLLAEQMAQQPAVWFQGDIRNPRVSWTEGLTLSQALLAAEYTWNWNPRLIRVVRGGEVYSINPARLLRGQEDPLLEPGDVIEVRH